MKPCERLNKLHHVTCIVVRSKGDSDPFAACRTYNPLGTEFLHGFRCAFSAVSKRNDVRRCGHSMNVMKRFPAIFAERRQRASRPTGVHALQSASPPGTTGVR